MLKLKLQYFGRANLLEKTLMLGNIEGKRRSMQQRMSWLDSTTGLTNMNLSKHWEIVEERGVHGVSKSDMTWQLNNNKNLLDPRVR